MSFKKTILKFVSIAFFACSLCIAIIISFFYFIYSFFNINVTFLSVALLLLLMCIAYYALFIFLKFYIYDYLKRAENKIQLISERIRYDDDFSALITEISEIDTLVKDFNERISRDTLDFSDMNFDKKSISGAFKIDYNNKKFIFSSDLLDFFKVAEYKEDGNICIANLSAYYDFSKNIGKSVSSNEENLYYEDTPNGRRWFNIFLNHNNNFGYGFIVDATDRIIADDINKFNIGKSSLFNKFYSADVMMEILRKNIKKEPNKKYALITAELNSLRTINEYYGYSTGNMYIQHSENNLKEVFKNSIIGKKSIFEYYIFTELDENEKPMHIIEKYFDSIYDLPPFVTSDGKKIEVKFNVGFAIFPDNADSLELLFKYSAFALYESKKVYNIPINSFSIKSYNNETYMDLKTQKLNSLLRNKELYYVYQPIVSLKTGLITAYEALMRPKDKIFISPREVIELINNKNLSYQFEKMTVFNCLETVNNNKHIFKNRRFLYNTIGNNTLKNEDVLEMREMYEDIGHILVPEIEETENETAVMKKCVSIHETGDKFAIDNFTGKSENFENIFRLKPTYVKIDRSLIVDIDLKPQSRAFVANLVRIAKKHEVSLIAIGVETSNELKELIKLGVDFAQGYYIAKPQKDFMEKINAEVIEEIIEYNGNKR